MPFTPRAVIIVGSTTANLRMKMTSSRPSLGAAIALARTTLLALAAGGTVALAVDSTPTPPSAPTIPIAHSALLTIYGVPTEDGLALHVQHAGNQIPIDGRDVTVSVDGKNQPVTAQPEGTFVLPTKNLAGDGERELDIVVAHDGIREILSGKVTLPKVGSTLDLWRDHKMTAWWVLNVGIVLVAVLAFSRRSSKPAKEDDDEE
jgi:hypothetical protein